MRRVITLLCLMLGIGCKMLAMNGTGTAEDPYQISTADELYEFADIVSGLHKSIDLNFNAHAVLMNDITINENVLDEEDNLNAGTFREWRPICKYQKISGAPAYQGVFDGQKHVIRGVYCTEGGDMSGFFSVLGSGAEVINVGFEDCYIKSSMGRDGGICGQCWGGHIRNCYFIGVVDGDGSEIGGICSLVDSGTIENCFSVANLSGHSSVDGICAINQKSEIRNCYSMPLKGADTELKERFLTGEIAYLLQQGQTEHVWGQKIGVDKYPIFDGNKVYACTDSVLKYSNHVDCGESHVLDHCVCTYCGYRDTTCACEHVYDNCVCTYCGACDTTCWFNIYTVDDLYKFAEIVYGVNFKVNARLMNDITINENVLDENGNLNEGTFREWVCKKKQGDYYQGIFEGNKHVIRGIYIRDGGDKAGFFSQLFKGEVRNLGIEDSYIASSQGRCGGICGQSWASTINNCYFIGVVKCGGNEVGGISSLNEGILSNCFSICKLTSASGEMDPVCRVLHKPIENCYGMYMSEASGSELRRSFESGEVAYLLQNGQTEHVWGQKIGVDKHPVFDGNKVYACTDSVLKYSNHVDCGESHVFDHCVCTYCGYRDTTCACEHVYDNCVCTYCGYRDTTCICEHVYDQCVCTYCGYRDTTCICEHVYVRCICIYCGEANHDLDHCVCKVCGIRDTTCVCEHELDHCVCIYCGEAYHEFDNCYCVNCKARDITCTNHEHRFENCYCVCGEPDTISDCWFNIYTVDDLYKFAEIVYGVNCKVNARLMNDITINENVLDENGNLNEGSFREWVCKKKNGDYYQGIFEGNKHVIRGIYIEDGGDRAGFFSQLYKGEVRNLGIEDSYIASSRGRCGGICGQSWESTINNCYFIGVVKCGGNEVGGISSSNEGILSNCFSICKLTSASGEMDPVCRVLKKPIENCYGMYMSEASGSELRRSFESGEVAYLLQNGQTEHVWGQKIGVDKHPVFDGDTVYGSTPCPQSFSNTQSDEVIAHDLDHCVCKACGFRDTTCVCEHELDHCVCIYCGEVYHEFDNCYCINCKARDITCTNHEHRFENCYCVCGEPDTISDCWFNIYTVEDFYEFARIVNDVNPSQNARLMNDIVLNEGHQLTVTPEYVWNPSNYCLAPWPGADSLTILDYFIYRTYSGVFDGQNHVIRGLCGILELGGIIQYMDGGEIRNVGFEDAFLSGCGYSAIVAEASNTKFTNCYVTGNLFAYGDFGVASLAAHSKACSFEGCYNLAKIICPGSCAGITCAQDGAGDVSINRCWNAGDVISQYGSPSGLVSFNLGRERERPRKATCSISNSYNLGKIETYRINFGGSGIVSFDALDVAYDDIYLENCYNAGIVSGEEHTDADPFCASFDCCLSHVFHFSNCYYLDSCVAEGNISYAYPDSLDVHAMSAEQFANGEVCYRLNKGVTDGTQPFYQNLNEVRVRPVPMRPAPVTVDPYPVLDNTHLTVYTDGDTYFNYKTNVGVEQISDDLSNPLVYVVDRTIYVCNVEGRVLLSDMNGRILFSQKVQKEGTSSCAEIPVRDAGAYLLVVNGAPCKVVAR